MNVSRWAENLLTELYLDPTGKGTVPSGPNCVCRGESGANFDSELFVSGPQPVARGIARSRPRTLIFILLGQTIIFTLCFLSFFFSFPNLSGRRLDVYQTSSHDVALVMVALRSRCGHYIFAL